MEQIHHGIMPFLAAMVLLLAILMVVPELALYLPRTMKKRAFLRWRISFSDLPTPAEASVHPDGAMPGYAQAGNRYPLFRDMR